MTSQLHIEHNRRIASLGGLARSKQFTPQYQRHAQAARTKESLRKGWLTLCARKGADFAAAQLARYRLAHPSALERAVIDALARLNITDYTREYQVPNTLYFVDFYIAQYSVVIEVNGSYWHDPVTAPDPSQPQRDQAKRSILIASGLRVIPLTENDIDRPDFASCLRSLIHAKGMPSHE